MHYSEILPNHWEQGGTGLHQMKPDLTCSAPMDQTHAFRVRLLLL